MSSQIIKEALSEEKKNSLLSLSVSRIKVFDTCTKQFKLQYIEKLPKKEWDFHTFGKFLHSVLEYFYTNWENNQWNVVMKEAFIRANQEYVNDISYTQLQELKELLTKYLFKLAKDRDSGLLPRKICGIEREFNVVIDDKILINGFVDLEQIDYDGIYHVLDYKTTKNKQYLKDRFQLETYAFICFLRDSALEKVRTSYLLFRHNNELMTEEYTRQDLMKLEEKFIQYANSIKKEKIFRAKPSYLCKFCSYLDPQLCSEGWDYINSGNSKYFTL